MEHGLELFFSTKSGALQMPSVCYTIQQYGFFSTRSVKHKHIYIYSGNRGPPRNVLITRLWTLQTPSWLFYKAVPFRRQQVTFHGTSRYCKIPSSLLFYKAVRLRWQQITFQPHIIAKPHHCHFIKQYVFVGSKSQSNLVLLQTTSLLFYNAVRLRWQQITSQPRPIAKPHHCHVIKQYVFVGSKAHPNLVLLQKLSLL